MSRRRPLRTELGRWRSRPAIASMLLLAVVFAAVAAGLTAWQSRPLSEAEQADAAAQSRLAAQEPGVLAEVQACAEDPASYLGPGADAETCAEVLAPGSASFLPRAPLDLAEIVPQRGVQVALVVVCLMVVAGSTFAGADWATRSMATQLTFSPRRTRLWLVKASAVVLGAGLGTAAALLGFWGILAAVAYLQGLDPGVGAVTAALSQVGRAAVLGAAAALGGFALTMALRHTVATLTLLFVYTVGGELLLGLLPWPQAERWAVGRLAADWVQQTTTGAAFCQPSCGPTTVPYLASGLVLLGLTVVAVLLSLLVFRRRDV